MSMWEIDTILKKSINLVRDSNLNTDEKRNIIWSLENIPQNYAFDAGSFELTEDDDNYNYKVINPFQLGLIIMQITSQQDDKSLIYDWSAFLLNYFSYFSGIDNLEHLKSNYLVEMKTIFHSFDFTNYEPIHNSLTIYKNGNQWFEEQQNQLIKWYFS